MKLTKEEKLALWNEYSSTRNDVTRSDIYPGMVLHYWLTPSQRQQQKKFTQNRQKMSESDKTVVLL